MAIFKEALLELGYAEALVEIDQGTFEGGDVAVFGDTCYIGVGAAQRSRGEKPMPQDGPQMERHGIQIVAVVNKRHEQEAMFYGPPRTNTWHSMHLDMFWIPLVPDLALAYSDEIDQREVIRITYNSDRFITEDLGTFREFHTQKGIEIIEVTRQEQERFATEPAEPREQDGHCSALTNPVVIAELKRRGHRVLSVESNKLVNGYGATHCLTAPVRRNKATK